MFDTTGGLCSLMPNDDWGKNWQLIPPWMQRACARCPVRDACLEWALDHDEVGVWGGTSQIARTAIRRGTRTASCPACDSSQLHPTENGGRICGSCGISWKVRGRTTRKPTGAPEPTTAAASKHPPRPASTAKPDVRTSGELLPGERARIPVRGVLRPRRTV